jgi:regulator of RNase E activity RraA
MECVDTLMEAYTGDFTLDGLVREVDLLGQHGVPLSCLAGYLTIDKKMMRVVDINVPLIVSDAWSQIP